MTIETTTRLAPQEALIHLMVMISASDRSMVDPELSRIGWLVKSKPAFRGFEPERVLDVARDTQNFLQQEDGMRQLIGLATSALPGHLHETAYAFLVDIAVVDLFLDPAESRLLQIIRSALAVDDDVAAAIELAARIRHRPL